MKTRFTYSFFVHLAAVLLIGGWLPVSYGQYAPLSIFQPGESVTYHIRYNWKALWVSAGEVTFSVDSGKIFNRNCLHLKGKGKTYRKWDWFYKVRTTYESFSDPKTLRPFRFVRDVQEGSVVFHNEYLFNQKREKAYAYLKKKGEDLKSDTIDIPAKTLDVLSMVYFARTFDFSQVQPGDSVPVSVMLDGEIYQTALYYNGRETIKVKDLGKVKCTRFSVRLIEGTIFKGGSDMTVWVSDDQNRVPILIESEILVGSIKASLLDYKGLKTPLEIAEN